MGSVTTAEPVSVERLREMFDYDPATGAVTWKLRPLSHFVRPDRWLAANKRCAGKRVGNPRRDGRTNVAINGKHYYVYRIAWALAKGAWPAKQIDHIDGNPANNALNNLREATHGENNRNTGMRRHNKLGVKGVRKMRKARGYSARIRVDHREVHLGTFATIEQASEAYRKASIELHGEFSPEWRAWDELRNRQQ